MFGGSGTKNAYMLVYRQRKIVKEQGQKKPDIPDYQAKHIKEINKDKEAYREEYDKKKNQFEMILQPFEQTFVQDEETGFYKYIVDENYETQGTKLLCEFTESAEDIKAKIARTLNIDSDK